MKASRTTSTAAAMSRPIQIAVHLLDQQSHDRLCSPDAMDHQALVIAVRHRIAKVQQARMINPELVVSAYKIMGMYRQLIVAPAGSNPADIGVLCRRHDRIEHGEHQFGQIGEIEVERPHAQRCPPGDLAQGKRHPRLIPKNFMRGGDDAFAGVAPFAAKPLAVEIMADLFCWRTPRCSAPFNDACL